jgi:hypothetical protein
MKVILNYDPVSGNISDRVGSVFYFGCMDLKYEEVEETKTEVTKIEAQTQQMGAEELIRIMKISAHINNPSKIKDI